MGLVSVMNRRRFLSAIAIGAAATPVAAQAPGTERPARIGILTLRRPGVPTPLTDALIPELRERGYVEGRNPIIEYPDTLGPDGRLPQLVQKRYIETAKALALAVPNALLLRATEVVP
jgi:hypothetical protein